jgi:hypothetical protein
MRMKRELKRKSLKRKRLKRKQKQVKWIQVVVKRSQKVLRLEVKKLEVMKLGVMIPVTQLTLVMETQINQLASPSNLVPPRLTQLDHLPRKPSQPELDQSH